MPARSNEFAASEIAIPDQARRVYDANARLGQATGNALAAPAALDILLFLLAEDRGAGVATSRCCAAVSAPRTTALRWIGVLVAAELVTQYEDAADRRITLLRLTEMARDALTAWLRAIAGR